MRKFLLILFVFCFSFQNSFAQCTCTASGTQYPSSTLTPTTSWQSLSVFGGEYALFNVSNGVTYTWSFCSSDGGSSAFDTRLNLYNNAGLTYITCNSDYAGCGLAAKIIWTATFSGVVRVKTNIYFSSANPCGVNVIPHSRSTLFYRYTPCSDSYEPNNSCTSGSTYFPVFYTTPYSGSITSYISTNSDVDWFRLGLDGPGTLTINLTGLPNDYDMELYGWANNCGTLVDQSYNSGNSSEQIIFNYTTLASTAVFLKIYGYNNAFSCLPYTLSINWTPAPPPTYSLTTTIYNVTNVPISNAKVKLWNSNFSTVLQTRFTNASGQVTFPGLANASYNYEVFYTPPITPPVSPNEEFWGTKAFTINGASITQTFTRNQPYINSPPSFSPTSLTLGQTTNGSFIVKNDLPYATTNTYVEIWVDRDRVSPWDYHNAASPQSIGSGLTRTYNFNVTPANTRLHEFYAFVYSFVNSDYILTDQYAWTSAFTPTCPTPALPAPTAVYPGAGAQVPTPFPTFTWNGSTSGVYHLQIWEASTNPTTDENVIYGFEIPTSSPGHCITGLSHMIQQSGVLVNNGQYKWSVHRNEPCGDCESSPTPMLYFQVNGCASPPSTPPDPISNSPQPNSVTISRTLTPPAGETWYWQGTICGTTTNLGSGPTFIATTSGTYYIRSQNSAGCWSTGCGSSQVTVIGPPNADFYSNMNNIRPGTGVTFTSSSSNATTYNWTFSGGVPSSYSGQNPPLITYNTPGVYTVSLTVNNSQGPPSTNTKTAYIRVAPDGTNQLIPPPAFVIGNNNKQLRIADPIQIGTSTYEYSHTDFTIPVVGDKLKFTRFYNSFNGAMNGPLGYGWSHSYNYSLTNDNLQDTAWNIKYPDGHVEKFVPIYNQSQTYPWTSFGLYSGTVDSLVKINSSTYTLFAKDNKQYQFNTAGQLTQIKDLNNNDISLNYSGNNLTSIVGQGGRTLTLTYNAGNKITSVTDPLNRNCSFSYDASGNLQTVTDAKSNATNFKYTANHLITSIVNPLLDTLVANTCDAQNKITSQRDAYSKVTSIAYNTPATGDATITNPDNSQFIVHHDSFYRQTLYTDEIGHTRIYGYDAFSNEISFTNENGNTETKQYDGHANQTLLTKPDNTTIQSQYNLKNSPTQITDARGNITHFNYDGTTNNLNSIQFADNTTNSFVYNSNGLLTTFTDGRTNSTTNAYSPNGDLISTTNPVGVKNYVYDAAGRLTSTTNENSQTSTMLYDNNDNISSITDALGRTTLFTYDANNQLLSTTDKKGNHTYFTYDRKGRLLTKTDAKGGITLYEYNNRDNLISVTDPRNNRVSYSYDLRGRKLTDTTALGITHYEYDNVGNLKKIIDPTNKSITYTYTNTNRVSSIKDGLNNTTNFSYDNNGNLVNTVNPLNKSTANTYNAMNRLTSVLDALNHTTNVSYDANGNRTSITDPNGHTQTYTYDAINRLIGFVDGAGNMYNYTYDALGNNLSITKPTGTITKTYDAGNRLLTLTRSAGGTDNFLYDNNDNIISMSNSTGSTAMSYDNMNQLVQYTNPYNKTVSFTYDAAGNKASIIYPGNQTVNYTYDAADNLVTVTDWLSHTFTYSYDSAGRNTQLHYPNGINTNYTFDGAARLTDKKTALNANSIVAQSTFTLDAAGNRINEIRNCNMPSSLPLSSNAYNYGNDDRMLTNGVWNFTNDNSGNRITETKAPVSANYVFTTDNLLTSFTDTSGLLTTYAYDPMGHRLSRINSLNATKYVLDVSDGLSKVLQLTDTIGLVKSRYVYGLGLLERIDSANNSLYYHFDAQQNTIALTDANDSTYDRYTYDPFGVILSHTGTTTQPFTFLGEYGVEKENTNFYYVRARYYDAANGRFLSKDVYPYDLNNPQTINRYVYSTNNPVSMFDYTGLYGEQDNSSDNRVRRVIPGFSYQTNLTNLNKYNDWWDKSTNNLGYILIKPLVPTLGKMEQISTAINITNSINDYKNGEVGGAETGLRIAMEFYSDGAKALGGAVGGPFGAYLAEASADLSKRIGEGLVNNTRLGNKLTDYLARKYFRY